MREELKRSVLFVLIRSGIFRPYMWFIDRILDWYCEVG